MITMQANEMVERFGWLLAVVLVGFAGLLLAYRYAHKRLETSRNRRTFIDYILIWPLFLGRSANDAEMTKRTVLTKREVLGWLIVIALMLLAIVFAPHGRG